MTDACPRCAKVGRLYATEHGNRCARCVQVIHRGEADPHMADDVTIGELARRLDRLEEVIDRRLEAIEEGRKWLLRVMFSSIAAPIVVAVILAFVLRGK